MPQSSRIVTKATGWSRYSRQSRKARGYGHRWDQLRAAILAREPLCRSCGEQHRVRAATTVDHITPKSRGGSDDPKNLQPLCDECHKAKTSAEANGKQLRAFDASGRPIGDPRWSR